MPELMPKPELAYTIFVGLPVTGITVLFAAVNWAVEQGVVWNAGRPDRKQVRANDRAARRTRAHEDRMRAWDEFGCDVWNWDE